jgi:hypothetical protein
MARSSTSGAIFSGMRYYPQGWHVTAAVLDVCYPAAKGSDRKDRFVANLTVSGQNLTGTTQSLGDKLPVAVKLLRKPTGDTFEFRGQITIGQAVTEVTSTENSDLSEKEFLDNQTSDDGITDAQAERRQDVAFLTVCVIQQGKARRRTVRPAARECRVTRFVARNQGSNRRAPHRLAERRRKPRDSRAALRAVLPNLWAPAHAVGSAAPPLTPRAEPVSVEGTPRHPANREREPPMSVELEAMESRSRELLSAAHPLRRPVDGPHGSKRMPCPA